MAKVKITQIKSRIGQPKDQKFTLDALGLKKINASVEKELNDCIKGQINKVRHLIRVENL